MVRNLKLPLTASEITNEYHELDGGSITNKKKTIDKGRIATLLIKDQI